MEEIIQTTISTTIEEIVKQSNLLYFDKATMILSIIALVISVWSVIWTARKNNRSSFKNNLYDDILKEALHINLPKLVQRSIDYGNKKVNDNEIDKLQDLLMELRSKILVFTYINEKFYNEIDSIIIKIDETIVLMINKKENFERKYEELMGHIKALYKCVEKYLFK